MNQGIKNDMNKIIFTICASNYIGLARVLETSIIQYNDNVTFLIFVADESLSNDELDALPANILAAKSVLDIATEQWYQMAFKYDLTEFCTSIKPSCFKYIFSKFEPESVIYLDPDILTFGNFDDIYKKLDRYSILLTPHLTTIEEQYSGKIKEKSLLYSGIYNLGFLALKCDASSRKLLDWWEVRLKDRCYQSMMESYFTDQKWMDFIPAFFPDKLLICSDLGLNLAPWNFYEREVVLDCEVLKVVNRIDRNDSKVYPLTFVHFSGFNYIELMNGKISKSNIDDLEIPKDIRKLFAQYSIALTNSDFLRYIEIPYSYNYFSNKNVISKVHRRLFRRLLEDGKSFSCPFSSDGEFFISLKNGGLINKSLAVSDKSTMNNSRNIESKILLINRFLMFVFRVIGPANFFKLVRLLRLFSIVENHIYLIDDTYRIKFKIRN